MNSSVSEKLEISSLDPNITNENILPPYDYSLVGYEGIGKQLPPQYVALLV